LRKDEGGDRGQLRNDGGLPEMKKAWFEKMEAYPERMEANQGELRGHGDGCIFRKDRGCIGAPSIGTTHRSHTPSYRPAGLGIRCSAETLKELCMRRLSGHLGTNLGTSVWSQSTAIS
jgi:hypothetical protein